MNIFILLLISPLAFCTIISQYLSQPDMAVEQRFETIGSEIKYTKKSNLFDKDKAYSLGVFKSSKALTKEEEKNIKAYLSKVSGTDEFLKKKGSSFNDLSSKNNHLSFIFLNEFRITQDSVLYPDLKKIFDAFQSRNWTLQNGIQLSSDRKEILYFKDGKEVKKDSFNFPFHCKASQPPTVCFFKDLGSLVVE